MVKTIVQPEIMVSDITAMDVDAIVNAANESLASGGGVCRAVHRAAGSELAAACRKLAPCATGDARITPGFNLKAKHVIHAVGPVYRDGDRKAPKLLESCYRRSLELAHEHGVQSIAFPCISTGIFGYPIEEATAIALRVMREWLASGKQPLRVICCCFTEEDAAVYQGLLRKS